MTATALIAVAAVVLDWLLGEPRRFHPLVGFGHLAQKIERRFYARSRWSGAAAVVFSLVPA
jgi:adenosylcobinamide-phosphate synthase